MDNSQNINPVDPNNDPLQNGNKIDGPGTENDRPQTPDDPYRDQGATAEEVSNENKSDSTSTQSETTPEKITNSDEPEPTDFDIDESTGNPAL